MYQGMNVEHNEQYLYACVEIKKIIFFIEKKMAFSFSNIIFIFILIFFKKFIHNW